LEAINVMQILSFLLELWSTILIKDEPPRRWEIWKRKSLYL